jgi:hydroxymethylpyrimidine/phosphomethylpyrimidine kinase
MTLVGALYTEESTLIIAESLQNANALAVVDAEAIFKTRLPSMPLKAVREKLLPLTTILSATVPEAKLLLDDAGVAAEYPKNMEDVKSLAKSVQSLGPKYVLIKREIFDETSRKTMLHFVLCGIGEPVMAASAFENSGGVTGLSYSIPCKHIPHGS